MSTSTTTASAAASHTIQALEIIRNEHRAIAAVLDALTFVVRHIDAGDLKPDFVLLASLVDYLAEMPDKLHHPKEDHLFAVLRTKPHEVGEQLDRLEQEHAISVAATSKLDRALVHYLQAGQAGFAAFRDAVQTYARYELRHLQTEERHIFPAAKRLLTPEDWEGINADFARNADPWRGLNDSFVALFQQIANLTPAPVGLADPV